MQKALETLAVTALFAALSVNSLAPEPEPIPEPEPPYEADNELLQPICEQYCRWIGDQWVCTQICY